MYDEYDEPYDDYNDYPEDGTYHMADFNYMGCCGCKEITHIATYWTHEGTKDNMGAESDKAFKTAPERLLWDLFKSQVVVAGRWEYPERKPGEPYPPAKWIIKGDATVNLSAAHYIFTDSHQVSHVRYGKSLAKYILKNKLGHIVASKQVGNPNHGSPDTKNVDHMITVYVWTPDKANFAAWLKAKKMAEGENS